MGVNNQLRATFDLLPNNLCTGTRCKRVDLDSVVGIATNLGMGGPRVESR